MRALPLDLGTDGYTAYYVKYIHYAMLVIFKNMRGAGDDTAY